MIFDMKRAVGYNGINVTATKPDLLDRLLSLHLEPIDKRNRRKLKYLRKEFDHILPQVLGCIFDILVKVLNRIGEVRLEGQDLPRMADFAEICELISRCLGYENGKFTEAYNKNIGFLNKEAISASPVATAIINLMNIQPIWTGKANELRSRLIELVHGYQELSGMLSSKGWPKTPHALSDRLDENSSKP